MKWEWERERRRGGNVLFDYDAMKVGFVVLDWGGSYIYRPCGFSFFFLYRTGGVGQLQALQTGCGKTPIWQFVWKDLFGILGVEEDFSFFIGWRNIYTFSDEN